MAGWSIGPYLPSRELRIGTAEREQAARLLGEHLAAGRLELAEFEERVAAAYAARTDADLRALFRDLPGPAPARPASARSTWARSAWDRSAWDRPTWDNPVPGRSMGGRSMGDRPMPARSAPRRVPRRTILLLLLLVVLGVALAEITLPPFLLIGALWLLFGARRRRFAYATGRRAGGYRRGYPGCRR